MSLFKKYKMDPVKTEQGIPVEFEVNEDGTVPTIMLARAGAGNKKFTQELERVRKPHQRRIDAGLVSDEEMETFFLKTFAKVAITGWQNVNDEEGKPLPYSYENALNLITELPELYQELVQKSIERDNYRSYRLEEDLKN